ncbi:DUF4446 family protein [Candidatus Saccharibacteria bacterium]|nr:DUF4446 family protein [Candidatus Saccharibacteria bacterium]MCB9834447.1 DUF4446 family protein [Candidatus Nomurabacteria bacterium]
MERIVLTIAILSLALSAFAIKQLHDLRTVYNKIFAYNKSGGEKTDLRHQLEQYSSEVQKCLDQLDQLAGYTAKLHKQIQTSSQKIGLIRFNPFKDTGGDQSFCLTILDAHNTGYCLSSIHTRSGTRVYCKEIQKGKSLHHLSEEEQASITKAISVKY